MTRKALLLCGLISTLLYGAMTLFIPLGWPAYSSLSQTISELSAIGAPTRPTWFPLGIAYTLLVAVFGVGVWKSAKGNLALRVVGGLLVANGIVGLGWLPMHQREVLAAGGATLTDTMHIMWSIVTTALMLSEIGVAAAALGERFRFYSIATIAALAIFGTLTFLNAPGVAANLPTPWLGVWERIDVLGYMAWVAVLSITLIRRLNDPHMRKTAANGSPRLSRVRA